MKLKISNFWNNIIKIYHWFIGLGIVKHILFIYLLITIGGSALLMLPISIQSGAHPSYLDALFTSASAFSDTGLVTQTTASTWTMFGQTVVALLILVGGVGWFALKAYLFNLLLGRPMSMNLLLALNAERGSSKQGFTRRLITVSITVILVITLLMALVLTFLFYYQKGDFSSDPLFVNNHFHSALSEYNPYHDWSKSFRFGIFHSISAINNAGFDIMGQHSVGPYYGVYSIQIIFVFLFVVGGIGYPVIFDIYSYSLSRTRFEKKHPFKWSLFTKVSCLTYLLIVVMGLTLTFSLEINAKDTDYVIGGNRFFHYSFWRDPDNGSTAQKSFALFFNTLSTRNAGFASTDIFQFSSPTKMVHSIMMFIGSAPSSTAGGIRTTTFAISVLSIFNLIRGKKNLYMFKRKIDPELVKRSFIVFVISFLAVLITTIVGMTSFESFGGPLKEEVTTTINGNLTYSFRSFADVWFEAASAFGTTGLSVGLTSNLNVTTKLMFILLMFIGQLGVSSTLLVWNRKIDPTRKIDYISEDIIIG
ncbi:MAG: hypothetical protein NC236_00985 [Mycoplasma sp.]|nr:hypothetical protein [Mycoplasma sp.]